MDVADNWTPLIVHEFGGEEWRGRVDEKGALAAIAVTEEEPGRSEIRAREDFGGLFRILGIIDLVDPKLRGLAHEFKPGGRLTCGFDGLPLGGAAGVGQQEFRPGPLGNADDEMRCVEVDDVAVRVFAVLVIVADRPSGKAHRQLLCPFGVGGQLATGERGIKAAIQRSVQSERQSGHEGFGLRPGIDAPWPELNEL